MKPEQTRSPIHREVYGVTDAGEDVELFTLCNQNQSLLKVITYGGIITELHVPDREGEMRDVVLGCHSLDAYLASHPWFGAITGRVAGRITDGRFSVDGQSYQLELNHPPNHLHGGSDALDKRIWRGVTSLNERGEPSVELSYRSPDGECGYPGNVEISVRYTLTHDDRLIIDYSAQTDQPTPLSLTNHSYFNLAGATQGSAADHLIQISCERFISTDEDLTLSGQIRHVQGQPNDVREPHQLGQIAPRLWLQHGDHYLTQASPASPPLWVARAEDPQGGICLDVYTNASGLQFYTGAPLEHPAHLNKAGVAYRSLSGFCFECQGYPDGVNAPEIDDIIITPERPYQQQTVYAFSTSSGE